MLKGENKNGKRKAKKERFRLILLGKLYNRNSDYVRSNVSNCYACIIARYRVILSTVKIDGFINNFKG